MKRSAFKSKMPTTQPPRQYEGANPSAARTPAVRIADQRAHAVVPLPKEIKAKNGKRTPTKAETAWMDWIMAYGCIACRLDGLTSPRPAVHHMLRGGQRIGHLFTLPLCDPGHHQGGQAAGMVSRHPWKARFEKRYGSEDFLLRKLQAEMSR